MDKQTQQVLIEARIVEATAEYEHQLGIQWGANIEASTATGYSTGMFFPNSIRANGFLGENVLGENLMVDLGAPGAVSGFDLSLGSIPGLVNLDARLSAMEADGIGKLSVNRELQRWIIRLPKSVKVERFLTNRLCRDRSKLCSTMPFSHSM